MTTVLGATSHPTWTSSSRCALSLYSELSRLIIHHPAKESPSSSSSPKERPRPSNPNGKYIKHNLFSFCALTTERLSDYPDFPRVFRLFRRLPAAGPEFSAPYPADPCTIPHSAAFCQLNRCHLPLLAVYFGRRAFGENFFTCHAQTPKTP